jgi:rhodanese-related sulfurtransferase
MKRKPFFSALVILASLFAVTLAHADDVVEAPIADIAVDDAVEYVAIHDNVVILDVRTPLEYEMSHITGAVNVDVQNESFRDNVIALDPGKTYIVHCTKNPVGGRSSRALETLQDLGFENLYSLEGGYVAWQEAELPLTDPSD